jgi:hypothetical protein
MSASNIYIYIYILIYIDYTKRREWSMEKKKCIVVNFFLFKIIIKNYWCDIKNEKKNIRIF